MENTIKTKKIHPKDAWDTLLGNCLTEATWAHIHYWVYNNFAQNVS